MKPNKYNVYDNGEICMFDVTASEITKKIGLRCKSVGNYERLGTIYNKRYTFTKKENDLAKRSDADIAFSKEWDKARFRLNKNAKKGGSYDF